MRTVVPGPDARWDLSDSTRPRVGLGAKDTRSASVVTHGAHVLTSTNATNTSHGRIILAS